jgi:hypothetical protein
VQLLLAKAIHQSRGSSLARLGAPKAPSMPPPIPKTSTRSASFASRRTNGQRVASAGPIPLQVIPYRSRR